MNYIELMDVARKAAGWSKAKGENITACVLLDAASAINELYDCRFGKRMSGGVLPPSPSEMAAIADAAMKELDSIRKMKEELVEERRALYAKHYAFYAAQKHNEQECASITVPCDVGEIVYIKENGPGGSTEVYPFIITNIMVNCSRSQGWSKKYRAVRYVNGKTVNHQIHFDFEDLGKTVFLSPEEAEGR